MLSEVKEENLLTLQALVGLDNENAVRVLKASILITADRTNEDICYLIENLQAILKRSLESVQYDNDKELMPTMEIVIGSLPRKTEAPALWVAFLPDSFIVSTSPITSHQDGIHVHRILILAAACYIVAKCIREIIGDQSILPKCEPFSINYKNILGIDTQTLEKQVDIGELNLIGAGAIGNGFLFSLSAFNVMGKINIVDPDIISVRNLNRCILFNDSDIGKSKALEAAEKVRQFFPNIKINGYNLTLSNYSHNNEMLFKKLVVAVDSRRARRNIQKFEVPGEVFDASTTGVEEFVIHYNKYPLRGLACLGCVYHEEKLENQRERHIAEKLGISIEDIKEHFITEEIAAKILKHIPNLKDKNIVGQACDSLFKELCGEGSLPTGPDTQILAPLAFVSVLAGIYLSIEVIKRSIFNNIDYNYWRLSPWMPPVLRLQRLYLVHPECVICNDELHQKIISGLLA